MIDDFNLATLSLANRFRLQPQEILLGTPKSRIRPNPTLFNYLIFSARYKKPPSPRVLTYNIPFAFPSPAKVAIRQGWQSRSAVKRGTCFLVFAIRRRMAILSESAAANESKGPTRRGSVSRLLALSVPNVSRAKPCTGRHRAKPRTEWCRAKSRGSALHLELSGKARLLPQPRGHPLPPLLARTFPSS
jgi:hypothetical protein